MITVKRLSLEDARAMIAGATAKAREMGIPMCIAVVDEAGQLIAFEKMDGGKPLSVRLSEDKAMTAAISRRGTHEYNAECIPGQLVFGIQNAAGGRFSTVGGGMPVAVDGTVVGAIGLSGGKPAEDMACAEAGIAALKFS